MMTNFERGSEWRKWDLHVHTRGTNKNDNFNSLDFDRFCITLFEKALEKEIQAIGITDYFSIDNFKKVRDFVNKIDSCNDFDEQEKSNIKKIFILPNVELRILPATDSGSLINIHCIFNPDSRFLKSLENDFFGSLEDSDGNKMNRDGLIALGNSNENNLIEDGAYKKGIEKFHLEPSQLIKLFKNKPSLKENTIIVVSNSSKDGASALREHYKLFENELGSLDSVRRNIYDLADAIFSGNPKDREFFLKDKYYSLKPCIHGSDAHSEENLFNPNKNRFCWIKADPTFEGLKQIIYEPEERVFIGDRPPILIKVENNKTNYLKSLEVNQVNPTHTGDTWFKNISIPFNKELIAIIGNKGSGKSGIADILGLLGDTHIDKQHFSFLHKNKFLKGKLADKFQAQIIWESDGKSEEVPLGANLKLRNPESVRFIPQNYFEELTNEIEIDKFQHVLENIIFEYIPENEKLSTSSFKELERYKTGNVNAAIQGQKNKIQNINKEIIDLEKKKHPEYLSKIEGLISKKEMEIAEQNKLLTELPTISNPNNGEQDSEQQSSIAKYSADLDTLTNSLKEQEKNSSDLTSKVEALKQFKNKIEYQQQSVNEFLKNNTEEAKKYSLDVNEILKVKTNYSSISRLISETQKKLDDAKVYFESFEEIQERGTQKDNKSIVYKIKTLTDTLKAETDKLTGKQKAFQQNEQRKRQINEKIEELTGTPKNPINETLSAHQKEKAFITGNLNDSLKIMRKDRIEISLEIFEDKNEIITLYNSFKESVDNKIKQNENLLEDYDIKIDSSFNLDARFYGDFLGYINQGKKGCFQGIENGESQIKSIVEDSGFNDNNKIEALLENIINGLEKDNAEISEQVNSNKLIPFYDYVFSLDYLTPKYELKLGDKVLSQLSPGERGALLLIFYLMIDKGEIPLIIDQPEDNLDNESVYKMLSKFIKQAKKKRQIVIVTHNPNLAVGADAEQIIHVSIDKMDKNKFSFTSGSIENPEINKKIVQILEGTKPAFDKRKLKYQGQ